ncbi:hypothetical protein B0T26DRAFT_635346, partial [Lasiosphaeria miniovina]
EHSPHKRTRIVTSYELGLSRPAIAFKEGVNQASISKVVSRYQNQISGKSLPCSGRPKALNERENKAYITLYRPWPLHTDR